MMDQYYCQEVHQELLEVHSCLDIRLVLHLRVEDCGLNHDQVSIQVIPQGQMDKQMEECLASLVSMHYQVEVQVDNMNIQVVLLQEAYYNYYLLVEVVDNCILDLMVEDQLKALKQVELDWDYIQVVHLNFKQVEVFLPLDSIKHYNYIKLTGISFLKQ